MEIRKNISLILGVAIPLLMIVAVACAIYLPGLFVKPTYDFVYTLGSDIYYSPYYEVENGKIVKRPAQYQGNTEQVFKPPLQPSDPKLYYYDMDKDETHELTLEEAQKYELDTNIKSPEGFEITTGSNGGFFPFSDYERNYNARFLKGKGFSKKLEISNTSPYYYYNFRFLGWVSK